MPMTGDGPAELHWNAGALQCSMYECMSENRIGACIAAGC